jgi:hypothetical protein
MTLGPLMVDVAGKTLTPEEQRRLAEETARELAAQRKSAEGA